MATIKNKMKWLFTPRCYEVKTDYKSVTVPDEAMTMREIMDKHVRGMQVADTLHRPGTYDNGGHESDDMEKVMQMDPTDRWMHLETLRADIKARKQALADAEKAIKAKEKEEAEAKAKSSDKTEVATKATSSNTGEAKQSDPKAQPKDDKA